MKYNILTLHLQQITSDFRAAFRSFCKDTSGGLSVEFVFVFPLLIWAYIGMFAFFHAFRAQGLNLRASYAVADFVTRQTEPMNMANLEGMKDVFEFIVGTEYNSWIRLTSIHWDDDEEEYVVDWSHSTDGNVNWTTDTLNQEKRDEIPVMAPGDSAVIVEATSNYFPAFSSKRFGFDLDRVTFENFIVTNTRFVPRVCWVNSCNDGY